MKIELSKLSNLEFDGIDHSDYPDFCDAFLTAGDYEERELTEKEIDHLNDKEIEFISERVRESVF